MLSAAGMKMKTVHMTSAGASMIALATGVATSRRAGAEVIVSARVASVMFSIFHADCATPHPPFGHLLPQGEKATTADSRFHCLLPLWEKVAKPDEGSISQHQE